MPWTVAKLASEDPTVRFRALTTLHVEVAKARSKTKYCRQRMTTAALGALESNLKPVDGLFCPGRVGKQLMLKTASVITIFASLDTVSASAMLYERRPTLVHSLAQVLQAACYQYVEVEEEFEEGVEEAGAIADSPPPDGPEGADGEALRSLVDPHLKTSRLLNDLVQPLVDIIPLDHRFRPSLQGLVDSAPHLIGGLIGLLERLTWDAAGAVMELMPNLSRSLQMLTSNATIKRYVVLEGSKMLQILLKYALALQSCGDAESFRTCVAIISNVVQPTPFPHANSDIDWTPDVYDILVALCEQGYVPMLTQGLNPGNNGRLRHAVLLGVQNAVLLEDRRPLDATELVFTPMLSAERTIRSSLKAGWKDQVQNRIAGRHLITRIDSFKRGIEPSRVRFAARSAASLGDGRWLSASNVRGLARGPDQELSAEELAQSISSEQMQRQMAALLAKLGKDPTDEDCAMQ